ncbi:MAG: outer membrane lipoprotein-sorting protein [Bacteroidales bacterium]|nr:outer membrane lipoprotein-sorting protein [Bacteroidales bacterium]
MKHFKSAILMVLPALFFMLPSLILAQSALDIVIKCDKVFYESSNSSIAKIKLSIGKYIIKEREMRFSGEPRIKILEYVSKDYGENKRDSRSLANMLEPISDKGIGMLTYEYDASNKDNDTWLYLPSFGKVKRMISSSEGSDESGSFFGSEFSIEDTQHRKIKDFTYKILEETIYNNRSVWIIESIPTQEKALKTKYGKIVSWVDKERFIIIKENLYDRNRNLYKQETFDDIEQIDNVWLARKITMNNLFTHRVSIMEMVAVAYNMKIPDEFLTQRSLTDFAYRERNLKEIRAYLK